MRHLARRSRGRRHGDKTDLFTFLGQRRLKYIAEIQFGMLIEQHHRLGGIDRGTAADGDDQIGRKRPHGG